MTGTRSRTRRWRNWAGTESCAPGTTVAARHEDDIVAAVRAAADRDHEIRVTGSGHSFNAIACTGGVRLDLRRHRGIVSIDRDAGEVTVRAGTTIGALNTALHRAGLAVANLGHLAGQTLGGAISTGNHGSGRTHPPLAGEVTAVRLVRGDGGVVNLTSAGGDPFRCVRTALGVLGVLSEVTLRVRPAFRLRVTERPEPLAAVLERFAQWPEEAEHTYFSFGPDDTEVHMRHMSPVPDEPSPRAGLIRFAGTVAQVRTAAKRAGRIPSRDYVTDSRHAFTVWEPARFTACEYAFPLAGGREVLVAVRDALAGHEPRSPYPFTVRVSAAEDAALSLAAGRPTMYLNFAAPNTAGDVAVLRRFDAACRAHGGRPHWGKRHFATAGDIRDRYPGWELFQRVRAVMDPDGRFVNDHLRRVLGITGAGRTGRKR
ncbi:D-arabinono-1,4-lactone oxidase [Amycolatopsis sp. NPDC021455]|uniref:D-arabinono-1,4-lactone oxidase n=1 Tax=Amycolatopsis sp. NPDC021455 TaxID=3154901 RepID=UPI0033EF59B6